MKQNRFITEEEFKGMQERARTGVGIEPQRAMTRERAKNIADTGTPSASPYKGYRSKLELNWANYLNGLKALKAIDDWRYEPMNFRLPGKKNFYKIDFQCWLGQAVTFYEIKGKNLSDDRSLVKLKTAAGLHPWATFILVKRIGGQWEERHIQ